VPAWGTQKGTHWEPRFRAVWLLWDLRTALPPAQRFLTGFVGMLCCRPRRTEPCKLALDIEELASPSVFRRTVLLRLDPVPLFHKGRRRPPANPRKSRAGSSIRPYLKV
jgi:hypothetical protein